MNVAFRIVLRQVEEDRNELGKRIASNVNKMVLPYIEKLKITKDKQYSSIASIVETNLTELISPFMDNLKLFNFTPREVQVASLIKDGKSTKEIAEIIGIAPSAINVYRAKIRNKLKLNGQKTNLQMYLQTLKK